MEVCHLLSASIVSKAIMNDSENPYKEASSLLRIAIISSRDVLMICFVLSRRQRTSHCSNWMKFLDECLQLRKAIVYTEPVKNLRIYFCFEGWESTKGDLTGPGSLSYFLLQSCF